MPIKDPIIKKLDSATLMESPIPVWRMIPLCDLVINIQNTVTAINTGSCILSNDPSNAYWKLKNIKWANKKLFTTQYKSIARTNQLGALLIKNCFWIFLNMISYFNPREKQKALIDTLRYTICPNGFFFNAHIAVMLQFLKRRLLVNVVY